MTKMGRRSFMLKRTITVLTGIILAVSFFGKIEGVKAADATSGRGITIIPPSFELYANPGESVSDKIKVRNDSTAEVTYQVLVEDFKAVGEEGSVSLIDDSQPDTTYSLAKWVIPEPRTFTLAPNQEKEIPLLQENKRLFQLYLDNNYSALFENLQISSSVSEKIYYCCLFNRNDNEIEGLLSEEATIMPKGKFIILLLHKMRNRLATLSAFNRQDEKTKELNMLLKTAPAYYKDAIGYAEKLFKSDAENYAEMETLLNKQEVKYKYGTNTIYFEHSYDKIWSLQAYAYDYYYFFKMNCLPFDNYSDPKTYLSYYLKSILCSYSPVAIYSTGNFLYDKTDRRHYPLGEIEIDMLVKYTHSKDLKQWIHRYSIQRLELVTEIDIAGKFMDFCKSYVRFFDPP
jgi:hypothetical protein